MPEREDHSVRLLWTDAELDSALSELHADREPDERALQRIRAELVAAVTAEVDGDGAANATTARGGLAGTHVTAPRRPKRWWRTAAVAAIVLALAAIIAQTGPFGDPGRSSALAAQTLERAAGLAADAPDTPIGRGQYRYIRTHSWVLHGSGGAGSQPPQREVVLLQESVREVWRPRRWDDEWLLRTRPGRRRMIVGSEAQARAAGMLDTVPSRWDGDVRGRCGESDPYAPAHRAPCGRTSHEGDWGFPTPEWMGTLPRDPEQLYERLREDALPNDRGEAELLVTAADALRTGLLPADLRAALYEALTYVSGLEVTERRANLDGVRGTALGMTDGKTRQEIIIDPATGRFIGEREVQEADGIAKAGTVTGWSSVTSAVVEGQGTTPAP